MRPGSFEYRAPLSLSEALNLLSSREDAKVLAGGQSLVTLMKLRLATPGLLVDINRIPGLGYVREENGVIVIGGLTRHDQLSTNALIHQECSMLSEAASQIADQQVRNRGTIGGSLAHADPTADLPVACSALGATIVARSVQGVRSIRSVDFFKDYFSTSLRQDEIIQEVQIPVPPPESGGAYVKLTKGHNDFAIVSVAVQLRVDGDRCAAASIVLGGVASTPYHASEAAQSLVGRALDRSVIEQAARRASESLTPASDFRASAEYRVDRARALTRRAIEVAARRSHGGV